MSNAKCLYNSGPGLVQELQKPPTTAFEAGRRSLLRGSRAIGSVGLMLLTSTVCGQTRPVGSITGRSAREDSRARSILGDEL
jgi:hypothetical protein